jgi:hypothetical protein
MHNPKSGDWGTIEGVESRGSDGSRNCDGARTRNGNCYSKCDAVAVGSGRPAGAVAGAVTVAVQQFQ